MPTGDVPVPRERPNVVQGATGAVLPESLRSVPALRIRRILGLSEGPCGPPCPAGPGGDGNHGRVRDVARARHPGHPPVSAEPRAGEGAATRRSVPEPGPPPRRDPGGSD